LGELVDDTMAYTRFVSEHDCYMILPETVITIEDSSWWHSTVCIRPSGDRYKARRRPQADFCRNPVSQRKLRTSNGNP
jgi:hypothetical protein